MTRLTPVCRSLPAPGPGQVKPANALSVQSLARTVVSPSYFCANASWTAPRHSYPTNLLKVRPNSSSTFQSETSFSAERREIAKIWKMHINGTVMYTNRNEKSIWIPVHQSVIMLSIIIRKKSPQAWIRSSSVICEKLLQIVTGRGLDGRVDVGIR